MPMFQAFSNEQKREEKARGFADSASTDMLCTIRFPRNLRLLSERLPKSNYGNKKSDNQILTYSENSTFEVAAKKFNII